MQYVIWTRSWFWINLVGFCTHRHIHTAHASLCVSVLLSTCCEAVVSCLHDRNRQVQLKWKQSTSSWWNACWLVTGAESASGYYGQNVTRHNWSRADSHMNTHTLVNLNVHLHSCCANRAHIAVTTMCTHSQRKAYDHLQQNIFEQVYNSINDM